MSAVLKSLPARLSLPPVCVLNSALLRRALVVTLCCWLFGSFAIAKDSWTELNLGPFYVLTDSDEASATDALVQLEQMRWVLGNLLENSDLQSVWPIRIIIRGKRDRGNRGFTSEVLSTRPAQPDRGEFAWQNGQYLLLLDAGKPVPLGEAAMLLLDANTPRLPRDVESGLRQLFSTLRAHGSHVTWGGQPSRPDLAWARMQLFATKFEYGASFHIFLTALKGGSTLTAAEKNAFGRSAAELEAEAQSNLAKGNWTPVAVSGRPLDPKRDLGQHSLNEVLANIYLADWNLARNPQTAEPAYKAGIEAGGIAAALGYEGLARVAQASGGSPGEFLEDAIRADSLSAPVYVDAARDLPESEALPLLKRAVQLNNRWAVPVYRQVAFADSPAVKETLLKTALKLDPRATDYWIELAKIQTALGEATGAQGSWLRAEDSASDEQQRQRIHLLAAGTETERLDAAAAAAARERNAARLDDERAQQAETDRIRAAEQKANDAVAGAAGVSNPSDAVAWSSLAREKELSGTLTRIDCLIHGKRFTVKAKGGALSQLIAPENLVSPLKCGVQTRPLHISLKYHDSPDQNLHTIGEITAFELR